MSTRKYSFAVYADPDRGPNRTLLDPRKALNFFRKKKKTEREDRAVIKATHLRSGLVFTANAVDDFEFFLSKVL